MAGNAAVSVGIMCAIMWSTQWWHAAIIVAAILAANVLGYGEGRTKVVRW